MKLDIKQSLIALISVLAGVAAFTVTSWVRSNPAEVSETALNLAREIGGLPSAVLVTALVAMSLLVLTRGVAND